MPSLFTDKGGGSINDETKVELALIGAATIISVAYIASQSGWKPTMPSLPSPSPSKEPLTSPSTESPPATKGGQVIEITDAQLQDTIKNYPKLVIDAYTPPCSPCAQLAPILERVAGETGVTVARMNMYENQALQRISQFDGVPTLFYYSKGTLKEVQTGAPTEDVLRAKMKAL